MGVYNRSAFLRSAIESLVRQTLSDLEIIVVDDGSMAKVIRATAWKYWEIITADLTERGWTWGFVSLLDSKGRRCSNVDAHRGVVNAIEATDDLRLQSALATLKSEVRHRRRLEAELLTSVETERQRIGQDLHVDFWSVSSCLPAPARAIRQGCRGSIVFCLKDPGCDAEILIHLRDRISVECTSLEIGIDRVAPSPRCRWPRTRRLFSILRDMRRRIEICHEVSILNCLPFRLSVLRTCTAIV